jgi:CheY-like chemotaxis protein
MQTRHSLSSISIPGLDVARDPVHAFGSGPRPATKPTILLVSNDTGLAERLRGAAAGGVHSMAQAEGLDGALQEVRSAQVAAVLLDLDMPAQGAWEVADALLQEPGCPPIILLTAQRDQFDMSTAVRAGALVDKATNPARVLAAVGETLALPHANRAEQNAIQRVVIRWLRPCAWSAPVTPAYRFWGLNE